MGNTADSKPTITVLDNGGWPSTTEGSQLLDRRGERIDWAYLRKKRGKGSFPVSVGKHSYLCALSDVGDNAVLEINGNYNCDKIKSERKKKDVTPRKKEKRKKQ